MSRPSVIRALLRRVAKVRGDLAAGSLGDLQKPTPSAHLDRFTCTPRKRHEHEWLPCDLGRVCSVCGLLERLAWESTGHGAAGGGR
jgi:hypothetical protein